MLRTGLQITFMHNNQKKSSGAEKQKSINNHQIINAFPTVGMTGFEPATTRPPDEYSNRTELHPVLRVQKYIFCLNYANKFLLLYA